MNNAKSQQSKITHLQSEALDILQKSSSLIAQVESVLKSGYTKEKDIIDNEVRKVAKAELSISIIAPMKAGKSTVINAISGMKLLPSHNKGMTTLPTEIELVIGVENPSLSVPNEAKFVLQKLILNLKKQVNRRGNKWVEDQLQEYSYLFGLAKDIQAGKWDTLLTQVNGTESISEFLTGINHIVRMCLLMEVEVDDIISLQEYPRITAPFIPFSNIPSSGSIGKLVLIDTPGADEGSSNEKIQQMLKKILYAVMSRQLEQSSLVLTVVDYTVSNNAAAIDMLNAVRKMVADRGAENIYVLCNKYDAMKSGEQNEAQIKKDVGKKFEGSDFNPEKQVFCVSGLYALAAREFYKEYQRNKKGLSKESPIMRSLFEAQFGAGTRTDRQLERATIESAKDLADDLWEDSLFSNFLEPVIEGLIPNALELSINSALKVCRSKLSHISDQIKLQRSGLDKEANDLSLMISSLQTQLENFEEQRSSLNKVTNLTDKLRRDAQLTLSIAFQDKELPGEIKQIFSDGNQTYEGAYAEMSKDKFKSWKDKIEKIAEQKIQNAIDSALSAISKQVDYTMGDIRRFLEENTEPLVKKIKSDIEKAFSVDLSPLRLDLKVSGISTSRYISFDYESKKNSFLKKTAQFFFSDTVWWTDETYTVSRSKFETQFSTKMEDNRQSIERAVDAFINKDIKEAINQYFEQIDGYLESYRNGLKKSLENQKLSSTEKEELASQLDTLSPDMAKLINILNELEEKKNL
ncbi:dynamin family protein [Microcoleus sp. T3_B1]|uniref:dynamin family protein n=1 Tax=Microcoleus sp. T3_B1 TaxID=3055425 RepID=UPI002FD261E6